MATIQLLRTLNGYSPGVYDFGSVENARLVALGLAAAYTPALSGTLPFSTTITFASSGEMAAQTVTGAIAFTAAPTPGASALAAVRVALLANGVNVPTFSGLREWGGSAGYVNTANVLNMIEFFMFGGHVWYSINQVFGAAPESGASTSTITRLGNLATLTEGGNGTTGWTYTSTGASFANKGTATIALPSSTDGYIELTANMGTGAAIAFGLDAVSADSRDVYSMSYGFYWAGAAGSNWVSDGSFTLNSGYTPANIETLRITRAGSTITLTINGVVVKTYTDASTGQLYAGVNLADPGAVVSGIISQGFA